MYFYRNEFNLEGIMLRVKPRIIGALENASRGEKYERFVEEIKMSLLTLETLRQ